MSEKRSTGLYRRLLTYVKPYWKVFALGVGAMVILAMTEPGIAYMLKPLLDGTFVERDPGHLQWMPIVIIVLFLVRGITAFVNGVAFNWVSSRVVYDLRKQMFDRLLYLPTRYFDDRSSGTLISKATYDVTQVAAASSTALTVLVRDTLSVIGLILYLFWLEWQLAMTVFLVIPVIAGVAVYFGSRMRRMNRSLQARMGDITHILEETVRGHKVVKIYNGHAYESGRFDDISNSIRQLQYKIQVAKFAATPIIEACAAIGIAYLIYVGVGRPGEETLSVGTFVSFLAALALLFTPIKKLTKVNAYIQLGLAAAESVFALIDDPSEKDTGNQVPKQRTGEVRLEKVDFCYEDDGDHALKDLDLVVPANHTVALVGASGSGKTTIATLIPRLYDINAGQVTMDGVDVRDIPLKELRSRIAFVSQDVVLFNDSVAANIAYGISPAPAIEDIEQAARDAHAMEFIEELPEGMDTLIGEDGVKLSGGQRQRLAIARALLKDAALLILDEATSALDSESEKAVQAALTKLQHERTTLVIAHRLSTVEHADTIYVLDKGQVVEQGSHAELIGRDGTYSKLYQTQFQT